MMPPRVIIVTCLERSFLCVTGTGPPEVSGEAAGS